MSRRVMVCAAIGAAIAGLVAFSVGLSRSGVSVGVKEAVASCDKAGIECLPGLTFVDTDGMVWTPDVLAGKVVLVNFWATWCRPCLHEIPDFVATYAKHKEDGLVILGVMTDEPSHAKLERFVDNRKLNYPLIRVDQEILETFKYPDSLPTSFIYDRSGKLRLRRRGAISAAELEPLLAKLIGEPVPSGRATPSL